MFSTAQMRAPGSTVQAMTLGPSRKSETLLNDSNRVLIKEVSVR